MMPRLVLLLSENWTMTSSRDLRGLVRIALSRSPELSTEPDTAIQPLDRSDSERPKKLTELDKAIKRSEAEQKKQFANEDGTDVPTGRPSGGVAGRPSYGSGGGNNYTKPSGNSGTDSKASPGSGGPNPFREGTADLL